MKNIYTDLALEEREKFNGDIQIEGVESYQKKEDSFTCEFSNPDVYAQAREDIINNLLPQASQGLAQYYGFSRVRYSYSEYTEHYRITVDWQYFEYTGN